MGLALAGVAILVAINLFSSNPFLDGIDEAAAIGGWEADQITAYRGSYGYRVLYAVAEVDATVDTEQGPISVHLEMSKLPIGGWTVNRYEVTS